MFRLPDLLTSPNHAFSVSLDSAADYGRFVEWRKLGSNPLDTRRQLTYYSALLNGGLLKKLKHLTDIQ